MSNKNENNVPAIPNKKGMIACFIISVVVISLYFVPYGYYVLYPFMMLYTFIHEMGHGITAQLLGGNFIDFKMWTDGSGVAAYSISTEASRLTRAAIAAGGLVAPAVMAAVCLLLGKSPKASRVGLVIFGIICVLSLILVVRNIFGFVFVTICALIAFGLSVAIKKPTVCQYSMLIIAITLLTAVFSRGDYLFTPTAQTAEGAHPSDVGQIAENLFLPYWFWGGLIGLISVAILIIGIKGFFSLPEDKTSKKAVKGDS